MWIRLLAAAISLACILAVAAGCKGKDDASQATKREGRQVREGSHSVRASIQLVPLPRDAVVECRKSARMRPVCGVLVPSVPHEPLPGPRPGASCRPACEQRAANEPGYDASLCRGGARGCFGIPVDSFNAQYGGEDPANPTRNRPPRMAHVVAFAGRLDSDRGSAFSFRWPPERSQPPPLGNGFLREKERVAIYFGHRIWGRRGELVLAPPYGPGGQMGNHLIFRWRANGADYAISLHGWEPLKETAATLRAMVESIR